MYRLSTRVNYTAKAQAQQCNRQLFFIASAPELTTLQQLSYDATVNIIIASCSASSDHQEESHDGSQESTDNETDENSYSIFDKNYAISKIKKENNGILKRFKSLFK